MDTEQYVDPRSLAGDAVSALRRVALVVIAGGALLVGFWAQAFPRSFYDDFPSLGRVWIALDGPYNEHLVRDVGGLNLGLAFVAVLALITGSVLVARAAGGAALIYGVPHVLYHATHLDGYETVDAVGVLASLSMSALAAVVVLTAGTRPTKAD